MHIISTCTCSNTNTASLHTRHVHDIQIPLSLFLRHRDEALPFERQLKTPSGIHNDILSVTLYCYYLL